MSSQSIFWGVFMQKNYFDVVDCEFFADGLQISMLGGYAPALPEAIIPDRTNNLHTHLWYELFFVNEGNIVFHVKDEDIVIEKGNFLLVNPNHLHYVTNNYLVPVFSFFVKPIGEKNKNHPILETLRFNSSRIFETDEKSKIILELLYDACEKFSVKEAGGFLFSLLLHISAIEPSSSVKISHDSDTARMFKIDFLLNQYISKCKIPSLEDVAYELNISPRQLSRIIKTKYGCSFTEKVTEMRMLKASGLLQSGKTVTETASILGYSSVRAFYTAFYSKFGITPGNYRKEVK